MPIFIFASKPRQSLYIKGAIVFLYTPVKVFAVAAAVKRFWISDRDIYFAV